MHFPCCLTFHFVLHSSNFPRNCPCAASASSCLQINLWTTKLHKLEHSTLLEHWCIALDLSWWRFVAMALKRAYATTGAFRQTVPVRRAWAKRKCKWAVMCRVDSLQVILEPILVPSSYECAAHSLPYNSIAFRPNVEACRSASFPVDFIWILDVVEIFQFPIGISSSLDALRHLRMGFFEHCTWQSG